MNDPETVERLKAILRPGPDLTDEIARRKAARRKAEQVPEAPNPKAEV